MKSSLVIWLLLIIVFGSCSKNDNNTIILKTSGQLKVQVVDKQNQPFQNIRVKLFDYNIKDILKDLYTDKSGLADFKDINSGEYSIIVDTPKINNVKYYPKENIQIISGIDQFYKIIVDDYVGNITLIFYKWNNYTNLNPFAGLNIIFINSDNYAPVATLDDYKLRANLKGITDLQGSISLDSIPSGITYEVIAYTEDEKIYHHVYDFTLNKSDIIKNTIYLDSTLYRVLLPSYK